MSFKELLAKSIQKSIDAGHYREASHKVEKSEPETKPMPETKSLPEVRPPEMKKKEQPSILETLRNNKLQQLSGNIENALREKFRRKQ